MNATKENNEKPTDLEELIHLALRLGASGAAVVPASEIVVEDRLAELCLKPKCENYGLGPGCPPHVPGPSGFRERIAAVENALIFKIDVPNEVLFSMERREVFRLLHEIAADIENAAVRMGFPHASGYAGGSCKKIFCGDLPDCRVLSGEGECRHPGRAKPSMSGFGIDVGKLMRSGGWTMNWGRKSSDPEAPSMGMVCGMVLLG